MIKILSKLLFVLNFNRVIHFFSFLREQLNVMELSKKTGQSIKFVNQGNGGLCITKLPTANSFFIIDPTSHLKSATFIEYTGGVKIGRYFHPGRGLTIFSSNHNYNSQTHIPYDETVIERQVVINDFVWCGSNVTIVPGVEVGEGAVIGSGSVVTRNVPAYTIVGGNPAKIIKYRDIEIFEKLKSQGKFL